MKKTLDQLMVENSKIFEAKEDEHGGHAFLQYSEVFRALFSSNFQVGAGSKTDMNQFGVINMMIHKLMRICNSFSKGKSDIDSAKDMSCYAVMLQYLYQSKSQRNEDDNSN